AEGGPPQASAGWRVFGQPGLTFMEEVGRCVNGRYLVDGSGRAEARVPERVVGRRPRVRSDVEVGLGNVIVAGRGPEIHRADGDGYVEVLRPEDGRSIQSQVCGEAQQRRLGSLVPVRKLARAFGVDVEGLVR